MNWDKVLPGIGSGESYRRIREALRVEKHKRWGEIGEIEIGLGLNVGYLAKVCAGKAPITIDRLLRVLERMRVDDGRFFANALGARPDNDSLHEEIEHSGDVDRHLARIEQVTRKVELATSPAPAPAVDAAAVDAAAMVAEFVTCIGREQRRRLGAGQKYRHPAFAAAYLEHLDALRYDHPRAARRNVVVVAVKLIPRLPGPTTGRNCPVSPARNRRRYPELLKANLRQRRCDLSRDPHTLAVNGVFACFTHPQMLLLLIAAQLTYCLDLFIHFICQVNCC